MLSLYFYVNYFEFSFMRAALGSWAGTPKLYLCICEYAYLREHWLALGEQCILYYWPPIFGRGLPTCPNMDWTEIEQQD